MAAASVYVMIALIAAWGSVAGVAATPQCVTPAENPGQSACPGGQSGEITICEGVQTIPAYAFHQCRSLLEVTLSSTVTSVGDSAFQETGLSRVTLSESITSIGMAAFLKCSVLADVTLPSFLTTVGVAAFQETGLTQVALPESLTSIAGSMFYYCQSLTNVTIPSTITTIGDGAFTFCALLTQVTIPGTVTAIGQNAFRNTGMTQVTIPSGVTTIRLGTFQGVPLTEVTLPDSIVTIEAYAFYDDSSLESVTFGSGIQSIGEYAFAQTALAGEVYLPVAYDSITIDSSAFPGSVSLTYLGGAPTPSPTGAPTNPTAAPADTPTSAPMVSSTPSLAADTTGGPSESGPTVSLASAPSCASLGLYAIHFLGTLLVMQRGGLLRSIP